MKEYLRLFWVVSSWVVLKELNFVFFGKVRGGLAGQNLLE